MGRKDKHRDALIETAMRLFRKQGYAGSGLLQITAESGAPKGSLYHYFPGGKEELAAAAVVLAGEKVASMLWESLKRTRSLKGFITRVFDTYAQWMEEGGFQSGCPIATTMLECAPAVPNVRDAGAAAFARWAEIFEEAYKRAGYAPAPAKTNAEALIAALEGALLLARVRQSTEPLKTAAKGLCAAVDGV